VEDQQLMEAVRAGETGRLAELFDRYHQPLYRYFLHLTSDRAAAEDLAQETFFRVLKYRRSYQPETSFRAWLYQVGRNVFHDHAGRGKGEVALPEETGGLRSLDAPPDRQVERKQESALLRRALAGLPREKREVLVMSRYLDLKYEEIASVLNCEVGTVKVRVYRALRELSDRFFALRGERAS
jgi:RNA polymerase sigma factor (sigma-70 family)